MTLDFVEKTTNFASSAKLISVFTKSFLNELKKIYLLLN